MEQEFFEEELRIEIMLCIFIQQSFFFNMEIRRCYFIQAIKELEDIFETVDNFVTEENVNSLFKYEFIPKKIQSHLTNFITYYLQTHNEDRARPNVFCFYRLSKLGGRYNRYNLSPYEIHKRKTNTIAFDGDSCVKKALGFCLKFKGEEQKKLIIK